MIRMKLLSYFTLAKLPKINNQKRNSTALFKFPLTIFLSDNIFESCIFGTNRTFPFLRIFSISRAMGAVRSKKSKCWERRNELEKWNFGKNLQNGNMEFIKI